ncbi:hypothetical protein HOY80DRAFT_1033744 [Tuber brumale]|nr:hypothetical protein HOY80DRAFT_1033744 [Tuber brumale]
MVSINRPYETAISEAAVSVWTYRFRIDDIAGFAEAGVSRYFMPLWNLLDIGIYLLFTIFNVLWCRSPDFWVKKQHDGQELRYFGLMCGFTLPQSFLGIVRRRGDREIQIHCGIAESPMLIEVRTIENITDISVRSLSLSISWQ